ncbi:uncharacterized protein G2W53_022313 [Senna tora]|uniref:Uncharacterized protein n=1 Tax=Senna tora TaxID=362788 RepID=A0A834TMS4_9FABA|nr:uncharacterized protein G2W53_022313 [Senna tora]
MLKNLYTFLLVRSLPSQIVQLAHYKLVVVVNGSHLSPVILFLSLKELSHEWVPIDLDNRAEEMDDWIFKGISVGGIATSDRLHKAVINLGNTKVGALWVFSSLGSFLSATAFS